MNTKTIKNIDDKTWRDFKILATKLGVNMGLLCDKEAKDILKISNELRKERGFRNESGI